MMTGEPTGRDMLNFIWPMDKQLDPGFLGRFGRLVHWLGIAAGVLVALIGFTGPDLGWSMPAATIGLGLVLALLARGVRYLLADE